MTTVPSGHTTHVYGHSAPDATVPQVDYYLDSLMSFIYGIPSLMTVSTSLSTQMLPSTEDSSTSAPVGDARVWVAVGRAFPNAICIQGGIDLASFGRT